MPGSRRPAFVLYEYDGRFENEDQPLREQAVYSVTPDAHTRFQFRYLERRQDGTLARRPPEPLHRPRWRWRVLLHQPRLLRFWQLERTRSRDRIWAEPTTTEVGPRIEAASAFRGLQLRRVCCVPRSISFLSSGSSRGAARRAR